MFATRLVPDKPVGNVQFLLKWNFLGELTATIFDGADNEILLICLSKPPLIKTGIFFLLDFYYFRISLWIYSLRDEDTSHAYNLKQPPK